jgi:pimeloyl-ACP methyl ester carboxylesterase
MTAATTKPQIFLIIGLTKESAHWDDTFVAKLKEYFETDEVVGIDLPGSGKFLNQKSPISIPEIVKLTRQNYAQQFEQERERILVSISLGGMVSTEWVNQFPNDFNKFVIINSSFKGFSPVYKRVQPQSMPTFFKILVAPTEERKEDLIIKMCSNNEKAHNETFDKWVEIAIARPMSKENMIRQTLAASRYTPKNKPEIPTYIIAAKHDKLAHYTCSQALYDSWGGDFKLIDDPKVGHGMHVDMPEGLAKMIADWAHE